MLAASTQTRQQFHPLLGVPHFDPLRIQTSLYPLTDQPTGHRVGVAANVDRAASVHTHAQSLARFQATRRQRTQPRQFLFLPRPPAGVDLLKQPTQEGLVLHAAGEVAAATQHQSLVQCPFELAMALLHVPVLVSMRRLDRLACQTIMTQQRLVTLRERRRTLCPRWDGCRQSVGAVHLRYAAQLPQGVLQALAEALVTLGEADRSRLPVRVGQDEVVDQVLEGRTGDGHTQVGAVREVAGTQPSRMVNLGEEYLLGRSGKGTPLLDASLQGTQLAIGKASRKATL